jgi:Tfp pilus assembly protein PilO
MRNATQPDRWKRLFYHPYALLVPWAGLVGILLVVWAGLHLALLEQLLGQRSALEQERMSARQQLSRHVEAKRARKDMARVLARLPAQRDFAPLALGLTEQARAQHVRMPGLSYQVEKTDISLVRKAVLQGSVSGRYEDLRRFIYNLETAEELLLIEDLQVAGARAQDQTVTFNMRIVTFLRTEREQSRASSQPTS